MLGRNVLKTTKAACSLCKQPPEVGIGIPEATDIVRPDPVKPDSISHHARPGIPALFAKCGSPKSYITPVNIIYLPINCCTSIFPYVELLSIPMPVTLNPGFSMFFL
jgi:hypothetical protein